MAYTFRQRRRAATSNSPSGIGGPVKWDANEKSVNVVDAPIVCTVANGHNENYASGTDAAPLNVVIVGAGIGGLTAAIGLRRNGHNVSVSLQCPLA